ncbi:unnamed protein product [Acanthoscelides obtectus]|uniref:Target of rapamycin complex 2 subunit MAPKAP1 n=1 Tax=Acanthoscelides obtectus TaxID=200917 RepID=A0A9P0L515_ACAOB|nr:unnamed protein product [Acanthoscelides obtectus]CAK1632746.1 Stress-activated map kinase-interacting protein 1 [Acanthoscelides obtectus]
MALYDNKYWLLSHIRNSFISTDDTGMCELVMAGEGKDIKFHLSNMELYPDPEDSDDEEDDFESYDLPLDMDFSTRERSSTKVQLEKLDQARKKVGRMRHIRWETRNKNAPDEECSNMFVKKEVKPKKEHTSKLSALMKNCLNVPRNPYIEYAKFDGSGQVNVPVKKYKMYITMLPQHQRNYPMHISCVANAKIQDLIGLILLKFSSTQEASGINLKSVSQYGLYITEEDGEVDRDFPCLDPKEPVSKFGFSTLGLVEHKDVAKTVNFPEDYQSVSILESNRTRTLSDKSKADENRQMENDIQAVEEHNKLMEAPLYKSFRAHMLSKVKPKVEVSIGVSGERIEIDPVPQKSSKLLPFKQKAVSHPIDTIAWCEITDVKHTRSCFRLVYSAMSSHNVQQGEVSALSSVHRHSFPVLPVNHSSSDNVAPSHI